MPPESLDIATASDAELKAASKDPRYDHLYYAISSELVKRSEEQKQTHPGEVTTSAFNPRTDLSADVKYLWRNVFIWFWLVPALLVVLYFLIGGR